MFTNYDSRNAKMQKFERHLREIRVITIKINFLDN